MVRLLALVLLLFWPLSLAAQEEAALVADRVAIAGNDVLVAEGNVEVLYQGRRLTAKRITYDRAADRLVIEGPIVLADTSGTFVLADQADLSADLADGILTSARLVLNRQLQMASSELMRIGGRYTRLGPTVASSCKVCAGSPTPLWEIRARRVIHDSVEKQIYFDSAQLRFGGVPVFWIPRLRLPDPTLDRATGFLIPEIRSNSELGTGLRLPYFIRLGDNRDLTVTPFVASKNARTLELRYRQAFATGDIDLTGAWSRDRILPGEDRGYAEAKGSFRLPRGFTLDLSGQVVSDPAYLLDYDLSEIDRLEGRIELSRTRADEYIGARLIHYHSIREGEVNSRLPSLVGDLTWERRFRPGLIGGIGTLAFESHSHRRSSTVATDSDGDGISDGRDAARATVRAGWRRDAVFGPGILGAVLAEGQVDLYDIGQDDAVQGTKTRATGAIAAELRWPLTRTTPGGARQVIEPVAQLVWAPKDSDDGIPNEDSVLPEFDEASLFALDRLPGNDAIESGARLNIGIGFTHIAPEGWSLGVSLGRVFRAEDDGSFGTGSGLGGRSSDWLATFRLQGLHGVSMTNRFVLDNDLSLTRGEMRLAVERERFSVASSLIWLEADAAEQRPDRVAELEFDGRYDLTPNWTGRLTTRYDVLDDRAASAGLSMAWRNECLKVDLSLSRRFTSSTSVQAATNVGLSVELLGFGGQAKAGPARACRG
ncbi:MAG: LPS-assembly protein LptD [Gemmobacter sp.]